MPKKIFIFILLAALAAVAYFVFLYVPKVSGLEVALKTNSFLDKLFGAEGTWIPGYACDRDRSECTLISAAEQTHAGQATLAYYFLAKATGDEGFKRKADLAVNRVIERCKERVQFCEWNYFPLVVYYRDTKDQKYLTGGLLPPAENFLQRSDGEIITGNVGMKLAALYEATGDDRFRDRLIKIADAEVEKQQSQKWRWHEKNQVQTAWSIYLPAYDVTKDEKYLRAAESVFENVDPAGIAGQADKNGTDTVVKAVEVLLDLEKLTKNESYNRTAKEVLQATLLQTWDNPENAKFNGDYGFISYRVAEGRVLTEKTALSNGWIIQLFLRLKDEEFTLVKDGR